MMKRKGANVFNLFVAMLILIPSVLLLFMYKDEIGKVCDTGNNILIYTVIASCTTLLSLMMVFREMLLWE